MEELEVQVQEETKEHMDEVIELDIELPI